MRKLFATLLGSLALATSAVPAHATTVSFTEFTVNFSGDAPNFTNFFGFGGGGSNGFGWNISPLVSVSSSNGAVTGLFSLPAFTVTPNAGWVLSGPVAGFLGNLVYFESPGSSTSGTLAGNLQINGGPVVPVGGALTRTISNPFSGYLSGSQSGPLGAFSSLSFSGGVLSLTATAALGGGVAGITAQPQNELRISFTAAPIPEPQGYIMLLAGLGLIGMMVRRRMPALR